mmetsp:Transcript_4314/g.7346  ORF Transcript_4314/g.7346 Transcript_4314/m.7346 type:complete len:726 (-) Transcript_4314:90-2267(-)
MRVTVVGGAGHVGLPLSLLLVDRGFTVDVLDKDEMKLEQLRAGKFPFLERGGPELLAKLHLQPSLNFTSDASVVSHADCIILTIGTPIDEHLNPAMHAVFSCIDELKAFARPGQTYILRSTLFPGTSQRIADQLIDAGIEAGVCFCPERIAQGFAVQELLHLPQIISGTTPKSVEVAATLFGSFGVELIEMAVMEAEVAKLFLNAWRYIHFATANQFYVLAEERGLDFAKIRQACCYKYPRASSMPCAGLTAGPCLFKDSMVLASFARNSSSLCHTAMLINETMPEVIVVKAKGLMPLRGKQVGLLGMAFKGGSDDVRDSLAFKVRRLLNYEGAKVLCTDVLVEAHDFSSLEEVCACPVVILTCPHQQYKHIVFRQDQHVIDCWGFWTQQALMIRKPAAASPAQLSESRNRFLVTGCNTCIGAELVHVLLSSKHEVWAVDADSAFVRNDLPDGADSHFRYHCYTAQPLEDVIQHQSIDAVISCNLAHADDGKSDFAASLIEDLQRVRTAVDACVGARRKGAPLERLVMVSSADVFEAALTSPCSESDLTSCPQPRSIQGTILAAAEALVRTASTTHGLPYVIARPSHFVGRRASGRSGDSTVDALLTQAIGALPMRLPAKGTCSRRVTSARDVAHAVAHCTIDARALDTDFNLSSDSDYDMHALAKCIWSHAQPGRELLIDPASAAPSTVIVLDASRARQRLGVECCSTLESIIEDLIPWARSRT